MSVATGSGLPYQYVVLRLVPRVDRQEFVNVGVVLHCQQADFLDGEFALDTARVAALAPGLDLAPVRDALETVCRVAQGVDMPPGAPQGQGRRFGWIAAPRSTILQPGPVHGGVTADPSATLRRLLETQVHTPAS